MFGRKRRRLTSSPVRTLPACLCCSAALCRRSFPMGTPDYSYHCSPGSSDEAVESILSQAMDQIALEQIAALNTSHLSDDVLPNALESRFRKLKSIPTQKPQGCVEDHKEKEPNSTIPTNTTTSPPIPASPPSPSPPPPMVEKVSSEVQVGYVPSSPDSSPPRARQVCCFGFYSNRGERRAKKKKKKGNMRSKESHDGLMLDSETYGILKEQRRKMKKALEEQEKVSREAEKLVEMVKQASARLDFTSIDDFLSEEEKLV